MDHLERARRYLEKAEPAISGQRGHDTFFRVACRVFEHFDLTPEEALEVLHEYNERCDPPFSEREVWHKVQDAAEHAERREGQKGVSAPFAAGAIPRGTRAAVRRPPRRPPGDELAVLLSRGKPARDDAEVSSWLKGRALPPDRVTELDLARALPYGRLPAWARGPSGANWQASSHRLLVPLYSACGALESVQARLILSSADKSKKALCPKGFEVRGLVMANPLGRRLLETGSFPEGAGAEPFVLIAEGVPDFLTWATAYSAAEGAPAVFGVFAGSWSEELAARIPDGCRVVYRTHPDAAGEKYADRIASTLVHRCRVLRRKTQEGDMDDNDRRRAGAPLDPFLDTEEVTRADPEGTEVDLDALAPLITSLYTEEHLQVARDRELLSLADLPDFHGWGASFNEYLGGGVAPGDFIVVGAASAGAGKSSFLMQLADGLALRASELVTEGEDGPLTPVLVLSEMSPEALVRRRLAWYTQERVSTWRAGRTAERRLSAAIVDGHYTEARRLLAPPGGPLHRIHGFMRQVLPQQLTESGAAAVRTLRALVQSWRARLARELRREVWPVLVVDPVQRFQRQDKPEVEALNEISKALLDATAAEKWICFLASDTNKDSAKGKVEGDAGEVGASLLRGSYSLVHAPDVAFYLGKPEGDPESWTKTVPVQFFKNRGGPNFGRVLYSWEPASGRFRPLSAEETTARDGDKASSRAEVEAERAEEAARRAQTEAERAREKAITARQAAERAAHRARYARPEVTEERRAEAELRAKEAEEALRRQTELSRRAAEARARAEAKQAVVARLQPPAPLRQRDEDPNDWEN